MQNYLWILLLMVVLSIPSFASSNEIVPKVGVYVTKEDILNARILVETKAWAQAEKNRILIKANQWAAKEDSYIRDIIPKKGSVFAYGIAGCPDHNDSWSNFGANGIVDLNKPNVLNCPGGHVIDFDNPKSKYYDSGNGVVINNVRYFFRGVYNAYIVNSLTGWGSDDGALHALVYAYALTGEDRYAQKAAVIFDALAHLSPTTRGPRDFNPNDNSVTGRMHFLTSIVHRSKVHFVRSYDILYNHPSMQQKSYYSDKTVAENIAEGLLLDYIFAEFDLRDGKLNTLHNHESDELRGMLATGIVLGIPEYIKWGLQGARYFFENTIDRDGLYYEGSPSYGMFTQTVFADIAELAYHYDPNNYDIEGLPDKVNFFDHPKLREFFFSLRDKLDIAGHFASFGNAGDDKKNIQSLARTPGTEFRFTDQLYHRTDDLELKQKYEDALLEMTQGNPDSMRSGTWSLFNVAPREDYTEVRYREAEVAVNAYYSGPSIAILGSGEGRLRRGILLRGGPNLPHSHDDSLALYYYDKGYLLTQDNGYYIFGSPVHTGWGSRAVGHNLVVVDNDKYRQSGWYKRTPGASLYGYSVNPGIKYVHLDNPNQFPNSANVTEYSRRTAFVDINEFDSYVFDVFTVKGGQRHDYVFHTRAPIMETDNEFNSIPDVWTLAGLDDPNASYDQEGRSWGERIMPGDMIRDLGDPSEGVKQMHWNPAPGNGYGFIYKLEEGDLLDNSIEARFKMYDGPDTTLTNRLFVDQETSLYKGLGPNLSGTEKYPYLILRSEKEENHESRVISVMDASLGISSIEEVVRKDKDAFVVSIYDGETHYITLRGGSVVTPMGEFKSDAEFAIAKFQEDDLLEVVVIGPGSVTLGDQEFGAEQIQAEIDRVDWEKSTIYLKGDLNILPGSKVTINNELYGRNSAYDVKEVHKENGETILVLDGSMVLARGNVAKGTKNLSLNVPLPTGFSYDSSTRYLEAKRLIREKTGESETIRAILGFKGIYLNGDIPFETGDEFLIIDVQAGDILKTLPTEVYKK